MSVKFPNIEVQLSGTDGNVFSLLATCSKAMRKAGVSKADIDEFTEEVFSASSYDEALRIMMATVNVG